MEKTRILVGLETDRKAYEKMQEANESTEFTLKSHAAAKEQVGKDILHELEIEQPFWN